jgi:hypothetical protein
MMQFTYALTQRDFFESIIAIRNRKAWAKWVFRVLPVLLVVSIVLSILTASRSQLLSSLVPLLFFLLFWTFLLWGSPWLFARQQFLKQPSAQGEHTVSFDSDVVRWHWNGGSSTVEWKSYVRWMETKNQILVCSSPLQCGIVPKHALNAEQLLELRTLLTQKLGAGLRV